MNILTFDIEEWFHIDFRARKDYEQHWEQYESRIHQNMDHIFRALDKVQHPATFFCIGWIARKYPEVLKRIDSYGHEIASHSDLHQPAYQLNRKEYEADFKKAIDSIEQVISKKVRAYRAPAFSIRKDNAWALEVMAENGIEIDCSIFPAQRDYGGFSSFKAAEPCIIQYGDYSIKEFPMNVANLFGKWSFVFSGGGYFRLLPYTYMQKLFTKQDYVMAYFHPRDFDAGQPIMKDLSQWQKFKSYHGLKKSLSKFEKLLHDFEFTDLRNAEQAIDWDQVPVIKIK